MPKRAVMSSKKPSMLAGILIVTALLLAGCQVVIYTGQAPAGKPAAGTIPAPGTIPSAAPATAAAGTAATTEATGTAKLGASGEVTTTAATTATAAAACPTSTGSIAVLLPDTASSPRWEMDDRPNFEAMLKNAGVNHTIYNAQGDPQNQITQAQQALADGAKVLILTNLDSESGAQIIAAAREAGAYVIDYDRLTIQGPGADVYVSFDNLAVGTLMGKTLEPLINKLGKDKQRVVQLNGAPTDNNATLVRAGYSAIGIPYYNQGKWELVADVPVPNWSREEAQKLFSDALAGAGEQGIDAVFAANDDLAGAVNAVLAGQGKPPILLSGQDATVEALQNILAGRQTMTVYKPIRDEVATAVVSALTLLNCQGVEGLIVRDYMNNGQKDIPFMRLDPVAVTKDNIKETVIADKFRTWEQLCVGEYEQYCPPKDQR